MPAPYGITAAGFSRKTLTEARTEIEGEFRARFGASINLNTSSVFGQLAGIFAEREAALWELMEDVYNAAFPDSAAGASLDNVLAMTGTIRKAATKSTATVVAAGTPTTVLPAGRVYQVEGGGATFESLEEVTIAAVPAWAPNTVYAAGARVTNDGQVYQEVGDGGTSAGAGGPTGTGQAIADNSATWRWIGTGTGAVDSKVEAQEAGANPAPAMTLSIIVTAVAGLNTVRNLLDAVVGSELETDPAARLRREIELRKPGNAAVDAIRAKLLDVSGVTEATVFENTTMEVDANGLPPKSVEALVSGGADADIRAALLGSVAAGIETFGTTSGVVQDAQGTNHTIEFSRPTVVDVWVRVDVKVTDEYPSDGDDQIRAAIVNYWNGIRRAGKNVVPSQLSAQAQSIDGVDEVTLVYLGLADPPVSSATLAIAVRELAALDTSRIAVNTSVASP